MCRIYLCLQLICVVVHKWSFVIFLKDAYCLNFRYCNEKNVNFVKFFMFLNQFVRLRSSAHQRVAAVQHSDSTEVKRSVHQRISSYLAAGVEVVVVGFVGRRG